MPRLFVDGGAAEEGGTCAPYTELDYNDVASPTYGTYAFSKVRAEAEAYKMAAALGEKAPYVASL